MNAYTFSKYIYLNYTLSSVHERLLDKSRYVKESYIYPSYIMGGPLKARTQILTSGVSINYSDFALWIAEIFADTLLGGWQKQVIQQLETF